MKLKTWKWTKQITKSWWAQQRNIERMKSRISETMWRTSSIIKMSEKNLRKKFLRKFQLWQCRKRWVKLKNLLSSHRSLTTFTRFRKSNLRKFLAILCVDRIYWRLTMSKVASTMKIKVLRGQKLHTQKWLEIKFLTRKCNKDWKMYWAIAKKNMAENLEKFLKWWQVKEETFQFWSSSSMTWKCWNNQKKLPLRSQVKSWNMWWEFKTSIGRKNNTSVSSACGASATSDTMKDRSSWLGRSTHWETEDTLFCLSQFFLQRSPKSKDFTETESSKW